MFDLRINTMPRHSCGRKVAMMVGLCLYSVVVGLLRHLLIATTQLSELDGASTDAQSPNVTLLLLHLLHGFYHHHHRITNHHYGGLWQNEFQQPLSRYFCYSKAKLSKISLKIWSSDLLEVRPLPKMLTFSPFYRLISKIDWIFPLLCLPLVEPAWLFSWGTK